MTDAERAEALLSLLAQATIKGKDARAVIDIEHWLEHIRSGALVVTPAPASD
jgi:LDH2 family malate/lactate/ureidoglycolate dehydrogenase